MASHLLPTKTCRQQIVARKTLRSTPRIGEFYPEEFVERYDVRGDGQFVLSRRKEDRKALPGLWKQAKNFAAAVVADGLQTVEAEDYEGRLSLCVLCPQRNDDRCGECGC